MATANTYRTLNDYRVFPDELSELQESHSTRAVVASVLAIALILGGAYYLKQHRDAVAPAAAEQTQEQSVAPAAAQPDAAVPESTDAAAAQTMPQTMAPATEAPAPAQPAARTPSAESPASKPMTKRQSTSTTTSTAPAQMNRQAAPSDSISAPVGSTAEPVAAPRPEANQSATLEPPMPSTSDIAAPNAE